MTTSANIIVNDTTLRDGKQSAGVTNSLTQDRDIARPLAAGG